MGRRRAPRGPNPALWQRVLVLAIIVAAIIVVGWVVATGAGVAA